MDLLIIDNELSGFLSGLEITQRLQDHFIQPATLLIAESTEKTSEQADNAGVVQVLSKQTILDEIVTAAESILESMTLTDLWIPQQTLQLAQECDVPPLPQLLVRLSSYMGTDAADIPLDDLANDISADPKATVELLKLINSAAMGLPRTMASVFDAIKLLGARRSIALILASATVATQRESLKFWSDELRSWYQKRCALIASSASIFAERMEHISPDTAFAVGLLQEIGVLALAEKKGHYLQTAIRRARETPHAQLFRIEQEDFHVTHADVSAALLKKWEMPQPLIDTVLHHHDAHVRPEKPKMEQALFRAIRIGEAFADVADISHPHRHSRLNRLLGAYGTKNAGQIKLCLAEASARSVQSSQLYSLPMPEEAELEKLVAQVTSADDFMSSAEGE